MPPTRVPCGYAATCGRPLGHRGQHGGWRSGIAAVAPEPYEHADGGRYRQGSDLGAADLKVLTEYAHHGDMRAVSACIEMPVQSVKNHLSACHVRTGAVSTIQVFALLGWLRVPAGLGARHAA